VARNRTGKIASDGTTSSAPAIAERPRGREFVQGLERGLAVIKAFSADSPSMTITAAAHRTGFPRAVTRRYLLTLCELGYVDELDGLFTLTPKVLDLGFTYLSTISVAELAEPHMERLVATLHESCSLAVLDRREVVYVGRVPAKRIMSVNLVVGSRLPAHATSMGKVLLAHLSPHELDAFFVGPPLPQLTRNTLCEERVLRKTLVRARGWAIADEESEEGIRSVAAPIFKRDGKVAAAINISAHASRVPLEKLCEHYLPLLLEAARAISKSLGAKIQEVVGAI